MTELELNRQITCADGVTFRVAGSEFDYCEPKINGAQHYSQVEVNYMVNADGDDFNPEEWEEYRIKRGHEFSIYAYVPIELVQKFIADHGGEVKDD